MKIWWNPKTKTDTFVAEQFLFLPMFGTDVVNRFIDFSNHDNWRREIKSLVTYTNLDECDVVVYPYKFDTGIAEYINIAQQAKKPLIAFYNDDNNSSITDNLPLTLYRTGMFRTKRKPNEFTLPAMSRDFADYPDNSCEPLNPRKYPIVGFCGYYASSHIRAQFLKHITSIPNIICNFQLRPQFWGGNPHDPDIRREYVDNMDSCDLVLCVRGAGNFSYRLYETISRGKTPLLLDTDCVFPCEDEIDWKSFCVLLNSPDEAEVKIKEWWKQKKDKSTRAAYLRSIYEQYLSPVGFTKYLCRRHTKST